MECMLQTLKEVISEAVQKARSRGWDESFHDVTGNLRSSIGGAVYTHGRIFFSTAFEQVLNGNEGVRKGQQMIQSLSDQYTDAIAATIVAAMDYADKVEALDSKDVIESSRLWAESVIEKRLKESLEKAAKEINTWEI